MAFSKTRIFLLLTLVYLVTGLAFAADTQEIENLRTFSTLYGYVRFFHPSDEAAAADWWRIAVEGSEQARQAADVDQLESVLLEIFDPLVTDLRLSRTSPAIAPYQPAPDVQQVVAWQHVGVDIGDPFGTYASIRTGRPLGTARVDGGPAVSRLIALPESRQHDLRLRFQFRGLAVDPASSVVVHLLGLPNSIAFEGPFGFDERREIAVTTDLAWTTQDITLSADPSVAHVLLNLELNGEAAVWFDDFNCEVRVPGGQWTEVPFFNAGFEADESLDGWLSENSWLGVAVDDWQPFEGRQCLRLRSVDGAESSALFNSVPGPNDMLRKELGSGLSCELPLWLPLDHRRRDNRFLKSMAMNTDRKPESAQKSTQRSTSEWLAATVITWNVMQHFYPYFDEIDVDWDAELGNALETILDSDRSEQSFNALRHMVAMLEDGHAAAVDFTQVANQGRLPIRLRMIEDQVVVTATESSQFEIGDIIVSIDRHPIEELLNAKLELISGSPQWKLELALRELTMGSLDVGVAISLDRNGESIDVNEWRRFNVNPVEPRPQSFEELSPGIRYVDLTVASMDEITDHIDELAECEGLVLDHRGYPNGNDDLLAHLTNETLRSAQWLKAETIYPDQEQIVGWDTTGRWIIEPRSPRIQADVVFLIDAWAVSYAESVLGIVEHYQLGDLVGRRTAGANGNANAFYLPIDVMVRWTGLKVRKHDGSQHHVVGIEPTRPVNLTIDAIREGRDEDIEAALALLLSQ